MAHSRDNDRGVTGIALSAALGFGIGAIGGMLLRGFLGDLNTEPVKNAVRGIRGSGAVELEDPENVESAVSNALDQDTDTHPLPVKVEALGDGIIELTGTAPDPLSRQIAADVARGVRGADIVVNRILVEGSDGSPAASD